MNFKEAGFRAVYHRLVALELDDKLRAFIEDFPDAEQATHVLMYGYIDPNKGLMLEVVAGGKKGRKYFHFFDTNPDKRVNIPIKKAAKAEIYFFDDENEKLKKRYANKLQSLNQYAVSEDLEQSRTFDFLDECREQNFPDNVRVHFIKDGCKPEDCRVKIIGLGKHSIRGKLICVPKQDFGIKEFDQFSFYVQKTEDGKTICIKDFNDDKLTKDDLHDGTVLKGAIVDYKKNQDDETFGFILALLHSSDVIVPCNIELNKDALSLYESCQKAGKDIDSMNEAELARFRAGMIFHPIILERKDNKQQCVPAFTTEQEAGKSHEDAAMVNMPFLNAIKLAKDADEQIDEIVVNPYTNPFTVEKELFDQIANLDPIVEEEESANIEELTTAEQGNQSFNDSGVDIQIAVGKMDIFNFALCQNHVPPVRGIVIQNNTGDPIRGLSLRITSDFDFFKPYEAVLPEIPSGKPVSIGDPQLHINGAILAEMTETVNAVVTVEIVNSEKTLCGCRGQMKVLAYDQWQGGDSYQDLLPAFVLPNHPVIPSLLHDAADRLKSWGKPNTLEGYQAKDPNRVRDLAAAVYAAIQKKNIVYAEPPASFSIPGQRIRTPESIMDQRLGTCMDMTLLYAACLEAMGLHPLLVMMNGHIFAGVWLRERTPEEIKSGSVIIDNVEQLTIRIDNGSDDLTFVECTAMCSGHAVSFEEAEKIAKYQNLADRENFRYAIDVYSARCYGITPIASRVSESGKYKIDYEDKDEAELTNAPKALDISLADPNVSRAKKAMTKKDLWESKLLDLSQHNMLLNLPMNASVEPIMSSHVDELEDALADGHEFRLLPAPEWITGLAYSKVDADGKESKPVKWLAEAVKESGVFEITRWPADTNFDYNEKFRQEFRNHRLYAFSTDKQLERELTALYRAARSSQQENGVSSLYLAIGLLRWFAPEEKEPSYAPLILLPIEIIRKSANQGYALHARDEEPHFNTTLLEMLKQNFNIEIGGLDPLPNDEHGINIKKVFSIVRGALYSVKNWDVVESCVIGNFSFAQFAMWNDIHTAGEVLENSDIVRSLMKGYVDFDTTVAEDVSEEKVYLPITVDATQLKAIKMASHGTTFVLHGPPGTGKSQTITAMIANLMAQGKCVLFVAEKMAALSVVQKRLSTLGIGDFCLELHSNKANKKQVLSQLEKALTVKNASDASAYDEYLKKAAESREKLDEYSKHLHQVRTCGYSLHELIDLYESVGKVKAPIYFDPDRVDAIQKEDVRRHINAISRLTAAGSTVVNFRKNPLAGIGLAEYNAEVRKQIHSVVRDYENSLKNALASAAEICQYFSSQTPVTISDLIRFQDILVIYRKNIGLDPFLMNIDSLSSPELEDYYDRQDRLAAKMDSVLRKWKPEFLDTNLSIWRNKHAAAAKKFFGKTSAMNAITAELQSYALIQISYDAIPGLLDEIDDYLKERESLKTFADTAPSGLRNLISRMPTRREYGKALEDAKAVEHQAEKFPGGLEALCRVYQDEKAGQMFTEFGSTCDSFDQAFIAFNQLLVRDPDKAKNDEIQDELSLCEYLENHTASLKDWALYNQARNSCIETGLQPVVDAYESGMPVDEILPAYQKGFYYAQITSIISADDVLSTFSGATFNESIQQFKRLDDTLLDQTKREIYYRLASQIPSAWESPAIGSELNLLRKAIGSNGRGISIRTLFERIPHVLKRLTPCMLMSPNSVAQYLAQDNHLFDVVIFDEASQLPTCKAIGALMRAEHAVIVGDPKQMPPTSFFAGGGPETGDLALDDLDSILDDALALGVPSQHLQWHYRSRHESLIAFSNSEFYDNKMFTFPSANERERYVTEAFVEGGVYEKGTNAKEAEAVVEDIIRRYHDPELSKQSIGVVTFNVKQQALIENLLTKQYEKDTAFDAWANNGEDPLFVKNLENVQGDERDVILFSIGYGPDENGHISMNFGPINKEGGGKRLNVAFSRARIEMRIFSSMHSSDIRITDSTPEGVVAFHDFLRFAEGYDLTDASGSSKTEYREGGILKSVCDAISSHGYQCDTMIGHSDFRVDIAVVNPYESGQYLMGIMLDGDNYRKTSNTRDREIAQIGVLKNLGWQLRRIWTVDWWDNREKVLQTLIAELDKLKEAARSNAQVKADQDKAAKATEAAKAEEAEKLRQELSAETQEVVAEEETAEAENKIGENAGLEPTTAEKEPLDQQSEGESSKVSTAGQAGEKPDTSENSGRKSEKMDSASENVKADSGPENTDAWFAELVEQGAKIVDKREHGGALWVIGGKTLQPIMQKFKKSGVSFIFKKGGGRATSGKDGWWAKTDVRLPEDNSQQKQKTAAADDTVAKVNNESDKNLQSETVSTHAMKPEGSVTVGNSEQQKPESMDTADIPAGDHVPEKSDDTAASADRKYQLMSYQAADLHTSSLSISEFISASNKAMIGQTAVAIIEAEGPMLKDTLCRRLLTAYGVNKTNDSMDAADKAIRTVKIKTSKLKGNMICWYGSQDPKNYYAVRSNGDRSTDELTLPEVKNALCYVLQENGSMNREDLVRQASRVLGYKRLGKNLGALIEDGLQYARTCKEIQIGRDGLCSLISK